MKVREIKVSEYNPSAPDMVGRPYVTLNDRLWLMEDLPTAEGRYLIYEFEDRTGRHTAELIIEPVKEIKGEAVKPGLLSRILTRIKEAF